jgi:hypothetical protein
MKVKVKHMKGKYRLVDQETGCIAKNANGTPFDGGGHSGKEKADRQSVYINDSVDRKKT